MVSNTDKRGSITQMRASRLGFLRVPSLVLVKGKFLSLMTIVLLFGFLGLSTTKAISGDNIPQGEIPQIRTAEDWKIVKEAFEKRLDELDSNISYMKAILRGIFYPYHNKGLKSLREEIKEAKQLIDKTDYMIESMGKSLAKGVKFNDPKVGNHALDVCREWGKNCGKPAADAWCKKNGYKESIAHEHQKKSPPTKVITGGKICDEWFCGRITSVTCKE